MKILYLITKSNWGGAQKYVYDLATTFKQQKHEVLVAFGGNGELGERLNSAGVLTYSMPSVERDISFLKDINGTANLYKLIKKERPDILHLNSSKIAGIGSLLGRVLGVKNIVVTLHGAPFREDRSFLSKQLIYFFTWITCLLAHKVITVSKKDEIDVSGMMFVSKKVKTIYLGLPYEELPQKNKKKSETVNIVTIAELHRNKGLIYGLEAINNVIKENNRITYSIFGEGEERSNLEKYIKDNNLGEVVILEGHVPHASKRLQDFDIFILPSVKEGLPYVLLEAGRAMLPVVSTITGGIPEIVRHEDTGLLVRPKDVPNLSKEISKLIKDKKFAKKLGQSLHSHITVNFSHGKMLAETAKLYSLI